MPPALPAHNINRTPLLGILVIGVLIRLIWGVHLPADDRSLASLPDQYEYLQLGRNLLAGNGLVLHDRRFDSDVYAYRTPGYPLLVAACGGLVRGVRTVQALLDASNILAVYLLARCWLSNRSSAIAALLVALNPYLIYFSGLILSETVFTSLLIWGMAILARAPVGRIGWKLLALVFLAFAVLVRPSELLLPVILSGVVLNRRPAKPYQWIGDMAMAGCVVVLALLPWAYRNHAVLGQWVWTTTNSGITLYDGFNSSADGSSDQRFAERMPELFTMTELQRCDYLAGQARRFIVEHPTRVIGLTVRKIMRTWSPVPLSAEYANRRYVLAGLLYTVPLFLFVIIGTVRGPLPIAVKVFLLLPAIYITIVHAASVGSLRYRIPADVPMAVLAAGGLCRSGNRNGGTGF